MENKFLPHNPTQGIVVMNTVPSFDIGKAIAHQLLSRKLAACVQIMPQVMSLYVWDGKITEAQEHVLLIKCPIERYNDVELCVLELHPYETPEIIALPITQGLSSYLNWMSDVTHDV